jgi:hypothetical protein
MACDPRASAPTTTAARLAWPAYDLFPSCNPAFDSWLAAEFPSDVLAAPGLKPDFWGAGADPDGDDIPNALEAFFNLDPLQASTLPFRTMKLDNDFVVSEVCGRKTTRDTDSQTAMASSIRWRLSGRTFSSKTYGTMPLGQQRPASTTQTAAWLGGVDPFVATLISRLNPTRFQANQGGLDFVPKCCICGEKDSRRSSFNGRA